MIVYKSTINNKKDKIKRMRNLGTLNKFLNGAKITKIKPIKLLIKKSGVTRNIVPKIVHKKLKYLIN